MALIHNTLAHLGTEKGNAGFIDELAEHVAGCLSIGTCSDEQQGMLGPGNRFNCLQYGLFFYHGPPNTASINNGG